MLATGTDEALVERAGAWRQDYTGPTGAQSVLQVMLGDAGDPHARAVGAGAALPRRGRLAARDPRGARSAARPRAASPSTSTGSTTSPSPTCDRVEAGLSDRPDVLEVIDAIEAGEDEVDETELPSGDELASEIERFLRDQS